MNIELCLFRHGRTVWNAAGRYQGHADIDLDDLGHRQSKAVAARCVQMAPARLFSSDLKRCADGARVTSAATGHEVAYDVRLRERDIGEWSGLTRAEVSSRFPEDFAAWMDGDEHVRPGGGESALEAGERVESFLQSLAGTVTEGTVVAFTHAGLIRTVMQRVLGAGASRSAFGVPSQASLTVVRLQDDGKRRLEAFNDRGHLLTVEDVDRTAPSQPVY